MNLLKPHAASGRLSFTPVKLHTLAHLYPMDPRKLAFSGLAIKIAATYCPSIKSTFPAVKDYFAPILKPVV